MGAINFPNKQKNILFFSLHFSFSRRYGWLAHHSRQPKLIFIKSPTREDSQKEYLLNVFNLVEEKARSWTTIYSMFFVIVGSA
jgi:hypothetical protein